MDRQEYIEKNKRWLSDIAYGKLKQPGIPGCSTLIFEIELINVM